MCEVSRFLFHSSTSPYYLPSVSLLFLSTTPPPSSVRCRVLRDEETERQVEEVGRERLVDKPSISFSFSISCPHRSSSLYLFSIFSVGSLLFLSRQ